MTSPWAGGESVERAQNDDYQRILREMNKLFNDSHLTNNQVIQLMASYIGHMMGDLDPIGRAMCRAGIIKYLSEVL